MIYGSTMRQTAKCRPSVEIVDKKQISHSTTDSVYLCFPNTITVFAVYSRAQFQFVIIDNVDVVKTFTPDCLKTVF